MNQNRNNNRRRGRNNRGPGGGGSQGNRIDSRARGNAPQMLEKYKKLAHDASLNGDRVQTEYYLQFADHYFRVIADMRSQKDDQQGGQQGQQRSRPNDQYDRDQDDGDDYDTDNNNSDGGDDAESRDERPQQQPQQQQPQRGRGRRNDRDDRGPSRGSEGSRANGGETADESSGDDAAENPFVRDSRPARTRTPRKSGGQGGSNGLDPASLPPAIGNDDDAGEPAEKPRRRTRARRTGGDDEALEATG